MKQFIPLLYALVLVCASASMGARSVRFALTAMRDSVSVTDAQGELVARILWDSGSVEALRDSITLEVLDSDIGLVPNPAVEYPLQKAVKLAADRAIPLPYTKRVWLIIFTRKHKYGLDHPSNLYQRIICMEPGEKSLKTFGSDITVNYMKITLTTISTEAHFLPLVENVLAGTFGPGMGLDSLYKKVTVPYGDTAILTGSLTVNQNIHVQGTLLVRGDSTQRISLKDVWFKKANPVNHASNGNIAWADVEDVDVDSASVVISNCHLKRIEVFQNGSLEVHKSDMKHIEMNQGRLLLSSCRINGILPQGDFKNAIVRVFDCVIIDSTNGNWDLSNCFTHIRDCHIKYKNPGVSFITLMDSHLLFENNVLININPGNSWKNPINIRSGSFGVIRRNSFSGFSKSVDVGKNSNALIYNNTFSNGEYAVETSSMVATVVLANNILYYTTGASLVPRKLYPGVFNRGYLLNNMIYSTIGHTLLYINEEKARVLVNENNVYADPKFYDSKNFLLGHNSPAIDKGAATLPGISSTFSVLDTSFTTPSSVTLTGYIGSAPDIGKHEYGSGMAFIGEQTRNESQKGFLNLSPGKITVNPDGASDMVLELLTIGGKPVAKWPIRKKMTIKPLGNSTGIYLVVLKQGGKIKDSGKLFVSQAGAIR